MLHFTTMLSRIILLKKPPLIVTIVLKFITIFLNSGLKLFANFYWKSKISNILKRKGHKDLD